MQDFIRLLQIKISLKSLVRISTKKLTIKIACLNFIDNSFSLKKIFF